MGRVKRILGVAIVLLLAGCDSPSTPRPSGMAVVGPPPGKAVVVFLRPALLDKAAPSPVVDVTVEPPALVGVVPAGRKVAYISDPGARRFMVIGEAADFLDAELLAGHIYYARIAPHLGVHQARFSLRPVAAEDLDLATELADCSWADETVAPRDWIHDNSAGVAKKKAEYLPAWLAARHPVLKTGNTP
jgi:hypothetical protein